MLHTSPPRPSRGALRVLRQLALYGSFGTAAGSAAFLLEEQRRQICRLSKMVENGKKIRNYVRQSHSNATLDRQQAAAIGNTDFAKYVQSMEVKGLVTRETSSRHQELGGQEVEHTDHYFTNLHQPPRRRRQRRLSSLRGDASTINQQQVGRPSLRKEDPTHIRSRLSQPEPPPFRASRVRSLTEMKLKSHCASRSKPHADPALDAYRLDIANRFHSIDQAGLEDYLAAKVSRNHFEPFQHLLDDCTVELPWSKPLYPSLLRSLARVDKTAYLAPQHALVVLALCRRIIVEGGLDPVASLMNLYQARAFQLVIDTYRTLPVGKQWSRVELSILLESALEVLDAGSADPEPLTRILRQYSKESIFTTHVLPVLKFKVKGVMAIHVLKAYSTACWARTEPPLLDYLEHLLSVCLPLNPPAGDLVVFGALYRIIRVATQDATCSEKWLSRLLFAYLAHEQARRLPDPRGPDRWAKIVAAALQRGFYGLIVKSFQMYSHLWRFNIGIAGIAQAYLNFGRTNITEINVDCLNRTIGQCFHRDSTDLVIALCREFQQTGLLTAGTTNCCWRAILKSASTEEALAILRSVLDGDAEVPVFLVAIENVQALLIRRTWFRTRDFDQVSTLYNSIAELTAVYNATHAVKLLGGQIVNAMLFVCAKAGNVEEASKYTQMLVASQSQPTNQAVPHFTLLHAKLRNWTKVESILDTMKKGEKMEIFGGYFFADLFQLYCEQHTSGEVFAFFQRCLYKWEVTPDYLMLDHLIAACMGASGDLKVGRRLLVHLHQQGLNWQIRPKTVVMAYRHYCRQWRPDGPVAIELLQTWNKHHRGLMSKNLCLEVLETCSNAARAYEVKAKGAEKRTLASQLRRRLLKQVEIIEHIASSSPWLSERSSSNYSLGGDWTGLTNVDKAPRETAQTLYSQMQVAFTAANYEQVIAIYHDLNSQDLPGVHSALSLAVISSLRLGNKSFAHALIQQAQTAGHSVHSAQLSMDLYELSRPDAPFRPLNYLRIRIQKAYKRMEEHSEPIRHDLLVAAAHHLTKRDRAGDAVQLIADAYGSRYEPLQPFDIVVMSAWVAAYGKSLNLAGVKWIINKVLRQNILIDLHFFKSLNLARNTCVQALREGENRTAANQVFSVFQVYDALIWRRYQTQRIQGNAIGRKMVATLVDLKNLNDQSRDQVALSRVVAVRKGVTANARKFIKKRARILTNRRARVAADVSMRQRKERVLRRRADRIKAWAESQGAEVDKVEGRGEWRWAPVAPVTGEICDVEVGTSMEGGIIELDFEASAGLPKERENDTTFSSWPTWNATETEQTPQDTEARSAEAAPIIALERQLDTYEDEAISSSSEDLVNIKVTPLPSAETRPKTSDSIVLGSVKWKAVPPSRTDETTYRLGEEKFIARKVKSSPITYASNVSQDPVEQPNTTLSRSEKLAMKVRLVSSGSLRERNDTGQNVSLTKPSLSANLRRSAKLPRWDMRLRADNSALSLQADTPSNISVCPVTGPAGTNDEENADADALSEIEQKLAPKQLDEAKNVNRLRAGPSLLSSKGVEQVGIISHVQKASAARSVNPSHKNSRKGTPMRGVLTKKFLHGNKVNGQP